jgi:hypothetical protein
MDGFGAFFAVVFRSSMTNCGSSHVITGLVPVISML